MPKVSPLAGRETLSLYMLSILWKPSYPDHGQTASPSYTPATHSDQTFSLQIGLLRPAGISLPENLQSLHVPFLRLVIPQVHISQSVPVLSFPSQLSLHAAESLFPDNSPEYGIPEWQFIRASFQRAIPLEPSPLTLPRRFGMAPYLISHDLTPIGWDSQPYNDRLPPKAVSPCPAAFDFHDELPPEPFTHLAAVSSEIHIRRQASISLDFRQATWPFRNLEFSKIKTCEFEIRAVFPAAWKADRINVYRGASRHASDPFSALNGDDSGQATLLKLPSLKIPGHHTSIARASWVASQAAGNPTVTSPPFPRPDYRNLFQPDNQYPLPEFGVRYSFGASIRTGSANICQPLPENAGLSTTHHSNDKFTWFGYQPIESWFHDMPGPYRFIAAHPFHLDLAISNILRKTTVIWHCRKASSHGDQNMVSKAELPRSLPYHALGSHIGLTSLRAHIPFKDFSVVQSVLPLPRESIPGLHPKQRRLIEESVFPISPPGPWLIRAYPPQLLARCPAMTYSIPSGIDMLYSHLTMICRQNLYGPVKLNNLPGSRRVINWRDRLSSTVTPIAASHLRMADMKFPTPGRFPQMETRDQAILFSRVRDLREAVNLTQSCLDRMSSEKQT